MATITAGAGVGISSSSDLSETPLSNSSGATSKFEFHSQFSLPSYHWQQCLHPKTREIYYEKGRTGMKAEQEPRMTSEFSGEFYSEDESSYEYDSVEYSSDESSSKSSSKNQQFHQRDDQNDQVLVVAGCKSCLMYFMVLKQIQRCPKCCGQLLHFDRSANVSSS